METLYAGCHRTTLSNGLTVLWEPRPDRPLSMGVWARLGSRDEADAQAGITHFLEHMVFKGTETRSAFQISEEIDAIGGAINAMTSREYTAYHVDVLPEHLERAMDVLSDLVRHPRFDPDHVAREKGVILEEIRMQEDTPSDVAFERFDGQLWADKHPLTRPIAGFVDTVNGLTRDDLIDQFGLYDTTQLFLVAVGDVDVDELIRTAEAKFGPVGQAEQAPLDREAPQLQGGFHLEDRDVQQAHLCLGTASLSRGDDRRYGLELMNTILGGGMSSRLFKRVREELGLAYAVFSATSPYSDSGAFTVYVGTDPRNAQHALDVCFEEIERMRTEPVPDETLRLAKEKLKGNLLLGLESSHARMARLGLAEIHGAHRSIDEIIQRVEDVTVDDVQTIARTLFEQPWTLSVVGPGEQLAPLEEALTAPAV